MASSTVIEEIKGQIGKNIDRLMKDLRNELDTFQFILDQKASPIGGVEEIRKHLRDVPGGPSGPIYYEMEEAKARDDLEKQPKRIQTFNHKRDQSLKERQEDARFLYEDTLEKIKILEGDKKILNETNLQPKTLLDLAHEYAPEQVDELKRALGYPEGHTQLFSPPTSRDSARREECEKALSEAEEARATSEARERALGEENKALRTEISRLNEELGSKDQELRSKDEECQTILKDFNLQHTALLEKCSASMGAVAGAGSGSSASNLMAMEKQLQELHRQCSNKIRQLERNLKSKKYGKKLLECQADRQVTYRHLEVSEKMRAKCEAGMKDLTSFFIREMDRRLKGDGINERSRKYMVEVARKAGGALQKEAKARFEANYKD